ncbi:MAG: YgiQ family radical SAM protein [candidate division WOR-3 bacterium]
MRPAANHLIVPPMSPEEMAALGWDQCDVIIVTGDAFVDHPAFGSAVIARVLLAAGYRVGIIAQPDWRTPDSMTQLSRPRLCFGVTAGNVDSMLANRSPSFVPRRKDDYSPAGQPGRRPDRATLVYCNLLRQAYKDVPLVIGGIEASLRRLAHYDYWEDAVRRSILLDARARILLYGMAERAMVEVCRRLAVARDADLTGIPGSVVVQKSLPTGLRHILIPSYEECSSNKDRFNEAFRLWHREADNPAGRAVVQPHGDRLVVQYPPPAPMTEVDLDAVYDLPFTRRPHPSYQDRIPALETVRFSITSHRGCISSCTFCSLAAHQGRIIQRRSPGSIVREAEAIARMPEFRGHITDVGGPTANMYAATCRLMAAGRVCPEQSCTWPRPCPNLRLNLEQELAVLEAVRRVRGVKKVSVGTGVRYDLLAGQAGTDYLEQLCRRFVSGQLRVAPEHVSSRVLEAMRKADHASYQRFRSQFSRLNQKLGQKQYLIPYFISGHPGATLDDAVELAEFLVRVERFRIRQVQQFTPLPMTAAAAMYHTGRNTFTGETLHFAGKEEQRLQRLLLQLHSTDDINRAARALRAFGRPDLAARVNRLRSARVQLRH